MSRMIKEKIVNTYERKFEGVADLAVVSTEGVNVKRMTLLRGALRARGMKTMRVHNRLGKRALAGLAGVEALLRGPSTLIWGGEGIVDIAKTLAAEAKTLPKLEIRGAYSAGRVLSKEDVEGLSRLPGRLELIAMVIGTILGQAGRVVALATSPASRILGQVRELQEKKTPAADSASAEAAPAEQA